MSNVIVPLEHQSAPKQTEADKEIVKAVEEISSGAWTPPAGEEDIWLTGTELLAKHPRVQEAMSRLEREVQDRTASEYLDRAQELHEMTEAAMSDRKWPGQRRWMGKEAEAMRLVNPLSPTEFIEKLRKAGVSAAVEPTVLTEYRGDAEGVMRLAEVEYSSALICLGRAVAMGYVGVFANQKDAAGKERYGRVDKLQVPLGPEWTLVRFDDYGVPIGERYHGWRTALLGLIVRGVITEEQAHKAFGAPVENDASSFYRQQLFEHRNRKEGE